MTHPWVHSRRYPEVTNRLQAHKIWGKSHFWQNCRCSCNTDCHPFGLDHWQISKVPMPPTPTNRCGILGWRQHSNGAAHYCCKKHLIWWRKQAAASPINSTIVQSNLANHPCSLSFIPELSFFVVIYILLTLLVRQSHWSKSGLLQLQNWATKSSGGLCWCQEDMSKNGFSIFSFLLRESQSL